MTRLSEAKREDFPEDLQAAFNVVIAKGKYRGAGWTSESAPVTLEILPK